MQKVRLLFVAVVATAFLGGASLVPASARGDDVNLNDPEARGEQTARERYKTEAELNTEGRLGRRPLQPGADLRRRVQQSERDAKRKAEAGANAARSAGGKAGQAAAQAFRNKRASDAFVSGVDKLKKKPAKKPAKKRAKKRAKKPSKK